MATRVDTSPTNRKKPCGLWLVATVIHSNYIGIACTRGHLIYCVHVPFYAECHDSCNTNGSISQMIPCYQNSLGIPLVQSMAGSSTLDTFWVVIAIVDASPCSTILSLSMDPFLTLEDCTLICR